MDDWSHVDVRDGVICNARGGGSNGPWHSFLFLLIEGLGAKRLNIA